MRDDVIDELNGYDSEDVSVLNLTDENVDTCLTYLKLFFLPQKEKIVAFEKTGVEKLAPLVVRRLYLSNKKNDPGIRQVMERLWQLKTFEDWREKTRNLKVSLNKYYPQYFENLIKDVIEDYSDCQIIYSSASLKRQILKYDTKYLQIVEFITETKSNEIFQTFSKYVANWMIKENFKNESLSELLSVILSDIKSNFSTMEFYDLYTDDQKCFIVIMSNTSKLPGQVREELRNLKDKCYIDFVIVITHCSHFIEYLNESL
jgi:hypothetical protein